MKWETVIGLEIHAQLSTKSKLFSGAATAYGAEPNTQACAIDLGFPGILPVLNREAVRMAVKFGLAIEAQIAPRSVFARKNYFYPDLPKGYQISQYELPVVHGGKVNIELENGCTKPITVQRAHLEEDAGKSLHEDFHGMTGIDLNRAGTPLIEIVSEPQLRSAAEAVAYMKKIHTLVRYLDICDGNMQEGSFRCDANVSIRPAGQEALGTRTEIKNLNSFRFVERAINYEVERQSGILEDGGSVTQETRLYDPDRNETRAMRGKEEAHDYRYFPDPDLLPIEIPASLIAEVAAELVELPDAKRIRFCEEYGLTPHDSALLTAQRDCADFFEATLKASQGQTKLAVNWVMGPVLGALNRIGADFSNSPVSPEGLGELIARIADQTISGKIAKEVFEEMWAGKGGANMIIEAKGLRQVTDQDEIETMVAKAIAENPEQVQQFRAGKQKVLAFFVGKVMKASRGKANPEQVSKMLRERLGPPE